MAYRKRVEKWLEDDCKFWSKNIRLYLSDVDCNSYAWHIVHRNTIYEVTYSDLGHITLTASPAKHWPSSFVREIYAGDNSKQSYRTMINLLADNFVDII
jgi:hypothetical protein